MSPVSGPPLGIADLATVLNELLPCCAKWYDLGIQLRVDIVSLDRVNIQYYYPREKLREVIRMWLTTSDNPTWEAMVETLEAYKYR